MHSVFDPEQTAITPNPFARAEIPAVEPPVQPRRSRETQVYRLTLGLIAVTTLLAITLLVWTA